MTKTARHPFGGGFPTAGPPMDAPSKQRAGRPDRHTARQQARRRSRSHAPPTDAGPSTARLRTDAPAYRPQRSAHSESETLRTSAKRPCTARAPYDPPAQTAFDAQKRTIRRPYPIPEIPRASHDRKGAACRKRPRESHLATPNGRTSLQAGRNSNHPARLRTDGSRSSPALHKNRPQSPPRRTSYRSPIAASLACELSANSRSGRQAIAARTTVASANPSPASRRPARQADRASSRRKPIPARGRPRLSAPRTHGHKNGSRSIRKPFRSIFYSCVSVSGSATRMRPQYSQMMIFLPCRMSD